MNKKGLILNIILLVASLIGLILAMVYSKYHVLELKYYTLCSNLLAFISSILYIINYCTNGKINNILRFIKINSANMLTVTFLVVIFVLMPTNNWNILFFLVLRSAAFVHFIVPILAVVSFVFFEEYEYSKKEKILFGISLSILYIIIISILIFARAIIPPYNFLDYYNVSPIFSILVLVFIVLLVIGISFLYTKNKTKKAVN